MQSQAAVLQGRQLLTWPHLQGRRQTVRWRYRPLPHLAQRGCRMRLHSRWPSSSVAAERVPVGRRGSSRHRSCCRVRPSKARSSHLQRRVTRSPTAMSPRNPRHSARQAHSRSSRPARSRSGFHTLHQRMPGRCCPALHSLAASSCLQTSRRPSVSGSRRLLWRQVQVHSSTRLALAATGHRGSHSSRQPAVHTRLCRQVCSHHLSMLCRPHSPAQPASGLRCSRSRKLADLVQGPHRLCRQVFSGQLSPPTATAKCRR